MEIILLLEIYVLVFLVWLDFDFYKFSLVIFLFFYMLIYWFGFDSMGVDSEEGDGKEREGIVLKVLDKIFKFLRMINVRSLYGIWEYFF